MNAKEIRKKAFEKIYQEAYWGSDHLSGAGSTLQATEIVRQIIERVIKDFNIASIVDLACGDFVWMPSVLSKLETEGIEVNYLGCDIVQSLIEQHQLGYPQYSFQQLDLVNDSIPAGDLLICREVLQHLPVKDILQAPDNISRSSARYLLATTYPRRYGLKNHLTMKVGRCRDRNLMLPPFNLPNPIALYAEDMGARSKFIGLWKLPF